MRSPDAVVTPARQAEQAAAQGGHERTRGSGRPTGPHGGGEAARAQHETPQPGRDALHLELLGRGRVHAAHDGGDEALEHAPPHPAPHELVDRVGLGRDEAWHEVVELRTQCRAHADRLDDVAGERHPGDAEEARRRQRHGAAVGAVQPRGSVTWTHDVVAEPERAQQSRDVVAASGIRLSARVEIDARDGMRGELAAEPLGALEQEHLAPGEHELARGDEAGDTAPHHHDALSDGHARAPRSA
jgi:hypothetical protein